MSECRRRFGETLAPPPRWPSDFRFEAAAAPRLGTDADRERPFPGRFWRSFFLDCDAKPCDDPVLDEWCRCLDLDLERDRIFTGYLHTSTYNQYYYYRYIVICSLKVVTINTTSAPSDSDVHDAMHMASHVHRLMWPYYIRLWSGNLFYETRISTRLRVMVILQFTVINSSHFFPLYMRQDYQFTYETV